MDKRDKPNVSFKATDGMSGKQDRGKAPAAGPGFRDYKGGSSENSRHTFGTTPISTGIGSGNKQRGNGGRHK
jgi:hypothetical protein